MALELIEAPAIEPVTLDEAKAHLRVDVDDDDALIGRIVSAAREAAEAFTGRAFIAQSWRLWRDFWPGNGAIEIPKPPLAEAASVTIYDRAGAASVLDAGLYIVDAASAPGRVVLKATAALPADMREANAIAVAFTAGYGEAADNVPAQIRTAILCIAAKLYEYRAEDGGVPPEAEALLAPYRVMRL